MSGITIKDDERMQFEGKAHIPGIDAEIILRIDYILQWEHYYEGTRYYGPYEDHTLKDVWIKDWYATDLDGNEVDLEELQVEIYLHETVLEEEGLSNAF